MRENEREALLEVRDGGGIVCKNEHKITGSGTGNYVTSRTGSGWILVSPLLVLSIF